MNGIEIEQLRDVIESALDDCGMSDVPWYCTAEPSSHQGPPADRRLGNPGVRVVWKRRENTLDFFDESGDIFHTARIGEDRREAALELTAAGAVAGPADDSPPDYV